MALKYKRKLKRSGKVALSVEQLYSCVVQSDIGDFLSPVPSRVIKMQKNGWNFHM